MSILDDFQFLVNNNKSPMCLSFRRHLNARANFDFKVSFFIIKIFWR